tara:strand:- start:254 stop:685 length:432 start_codon:yes stop_codon:yes gene_type:complete
MDIYFVKLIFKTNVHDTWEESDWFQWTMSLNTLHQLDYWLKVHGDDWYGDKDEFWSIDDYLIAQKVTKLQSNKFVGFVNNYREIIQNLGRDYPITVWPDYIPHCIEEMERLKYRADNTLGKMCLKQSLIDDGINDIFVEEAAI